MTKAKYELPICPVCNKHNRYRRAWRVDGVTPIFHSKCDHCRKMTKAHRRYKRNERKDYCEKCGFKGHRCQLDIDHIDGNNKNNSPENIQTLCANCHRLKTYLNKDWIIKGEEE